VYIWEDNFQTETKRTNVGGMWTEFIWLKVGRVWESCEHVNTFLDSIKCWECGSIY
jgi:hypothetical protein